MGGVPHWCFVGAKVVCVDGSPHSDGDGYLGDLPVRGRTYIVGMPDVLDPVKVRIALGSLTNLDLAGRDWGWDVSRFRPLVTRTVEQDAEMFRRLLTTERVSA